MTKFNYAIVKFTEFKIVVDLYYDELGGTGNIITNFVGTLKFNKRQFEIFDRAGIKYELGDGVISFENEGPETKNNGNCYSYTAVFEFNETTGELECVRIAV